MKLIRLLSVLALVFASSCATQSIRFSDEYTNANPHLEKSQPFFIAGLGQTQDIEISPICKAKGVEKVETKQTFVDGLLGVITFGIYTPRTVAVYCK